VALTPPGSAVRGMLAEVGVRGVVLSALWVVAAAIGVPLLLASPQMPWALARADAALGAGRPVTAAARYERLVDAAPSLATRRAARERLALLYATQLGDVVRARRTLDDLLAEGGLSPAEEADLLERVAELLIEEDQPEGAAARYEAAAMADPSSARRAPRLLRAAQVLAAARRDRQAELLYRRIARDHPAWSGHASLGRARLLLRRGKVERALSQFEATLSLTYDPDVAAVARLGRATCLERLGDVESALEELEEVEVLTDELREERAGTLRQRQRPVVPSAER